MTRNVFVREMGRFVFAYRQKLSQSTLAVYYDILGDADDNEAVVDFGGVHAKPWPRRLVDAAEFPDVVEHRFQQVDRHDHVDVLGLAVALAFELQRADAD